MDRAAHPPRGGLGPFQPAGSPLDPAPGPAQRTCLRQLRITARLFQ
jgi:hypothetical protein